MSEGEDQQRHTENSMEGSFNGLAVQAETIHGGIHHTTHVPTPSVWVQLLGGWMIGAEFVGLPLSEGAEQVKILNRAEKKPGLVVQAVNDGLVPVTIERVSLQYTRADVDTPLEFSLPHVIPGAPAVPHRLDGQTSASWPVDLSMFDILIAATLGSALPSDLPIRAHINTGSGKSIPGAWEQYGSVPTQSI